MALANEILRVALHYAQPNAGDIMNVFHFQLDGVVGDDEEVLYDVAIWIDEEWGDTWKVLACSACELTSWECDIMNEDGTVNRNLGAGLLNTVGTVGGEVQAAASSGYLLVYTPIPKARGSKYVPGVPEASVANGKIDATGLSRLAALLLIYMLEWTGPLGLTLTPGVLSKTLGVFVQFSASGLVDDLPAYQRRRKAGVGI